MKTQERDAKDPRTYAIIGAAMAVHGKLGCGFLEAVYNKAFAVELEFRGIPYQREVEFPLFYRGQSLDTPYRADFICSGSVIVELKALARTTRLEESQVINYLKASGHEVGLLLNFGARSLEFQRIVLSQHA